MNRQINYKTMRIVVGLIAILLAPITLLLAHSNQSLNSISITYWTDSQNIFVGSLIAVGFFLAAYNGNEEGKGKQFYFSKAACLFAVCVALFPTQGFSDLDTPPNWIVHISNFFGLKSTYIHYTAAILLFAYLIFMMFSFSKNAKKKQKTLRAVVYKLIGCLMLAGIVTLFLLGTLLGWKNTVLLVEIWGLTFFGIGWLIAGAYDNKLLSLINK